MRIKSKISVKEEDVGFDAIKAEMDKMAKNPQTHVGVQADEDSELIMIARVNEFGSRNNHVPARSYIRSSMDENIEDIYTLVRRMYDLILLGKMETMRGLGFIGAKMESVIKRKITTLDTPPNAPSTIRQKKSSNPLIDTGRLRSSIRHVEFESGDRIE